MNNEPSGAIMKLVVALNNDTRFFDDLFDERITQPRTAMEGLVKVAAVVQYNSLLPLRFNAEMVALALVLDSGACLADVGRILKTWPDGVFAEAPRGIVLGRASRAKIGANAHGLA
jgi:hypothetical protein